MLVSQLHLPCPVSSLPPAEAYRILMCLEKSNVGHLKDLLYALFRSAVQPPAYSGVYLVVTRNLVGWAVYNVGTDKWSYISMTLSALKNYPIESCQVTADFFGYFCWAGLSERLSSLS